VTTDTSTPNATIGISAMSNVKIRLFTPPNVKVGPGFAFGVTCAATRRDTNEYR
jgi:hypothetical protein